MYQTRTATEHLERQAVLASAPDPNDLLNSASARRMVGDISDVTLWRWSRDRGFPVPDAMIGGRNFWRRSTVQNWIAAQIRGAK